MTTKTDLGTLEASGLIRVAAYQPELEYLFRHALVQDAAYSSLLKQDRRALHTLAAETLLSLYPDRRRELAAVIAMHFEQAGDVGSAVEHLIVAGEHALERFAQREAVAFFARAVELLPADDPRLDLRMRAAIGTARAGWTFSGLSGAQEQVERAIAIAGDRADRKLLAEAYFWVAFLRRMSGESPESSPPLKHALERVEAIGEELGDPSARAIPKAFMGAGVMFNGELRQGAQMLSEALDVLEGHTDPLSTAILSGFLTITYARLGEFAAAERALGRSKRFAEQGDGIARLDSNIARVSILLERGDIDEGSALASQCADTSEALGAVACSVAANVLLGQSRLILEDAPGALGPLERGLELSLVTYMAPMRTLAQGMLGSVNARLGDLPAADAGWNDALAAAHTAGDRFGEAVTLWSRARTHLRQGAPDWAAALSDLDAAVALFEAMEARPSLARALRDRAEVLRAVGRGGEADEAERQSREIAAQIGLKDFS
jgi:tetratricopeptide (TPR) repeat protein